MNDQQVEQEIQAKGLTAPRVTSVDIEANIEGEVYFTAAQGAHGAAIAHAEIEPGYYSPPSLGLLTFCVLILRNGFTVTGESACASPENFDSELGRKIARENAVQKMWPLMGYALKQQLHNLATMPPLSISGTPDNMVIPMPDGSSFTVTKTYPDGVAATGTAPLTDASPKA